MIARMLQRKRLQLSTKYPFVTIIGPRQSGKSTLAELTFPDYRRVSLEDLDNREFAAEDPRGFIATYPDKTIIDEVQRVPSLLSYLQTHTDRERRTGMYILTGSQNTALMEAVDQSLAGRVGILTLLPLSHEEMRGAGILPETIDGEIFAGAYPALYDRNIAPADYYPNDIKTYIERDVRQYGQRGGPDPYGSRYAVCLRDQVGGDLCERVFQGGELLEQTLRCRCRPQERPLRRRALHDHI